MPLLDFLYRALSSLEKAINASSAAVRGKGGKQ